MKKRTPPVKGSRVSLRKKSLMSKGLAFCLMSPVAVVLVEFSVLVFLSPAVSWDGLVFPAGDELASSPFVEPFRPTEINGNFPLSEKPHCTFLFALP